MKKLLVITALAICFMTVEIVGGIISDSLSILTDAAHQLSDVLGFVLSIAAVKISQRPSTLRHTFGMYRCEIMGAMATVFIIWALIIYICYEAVRRIMDLDSFEIEGESMLITSCVGLAFNVANLIVLKYAFNEEEEKKPELKQVSPNTENAADGADVEKNEKEKPKENTNVRAAIIHLAGDGVQAFGVIIAAIIIYCQPTWKIADPITAFVFTILVLGTTVPIFIDCMKLLMENAPSDLDMVAVYNGIYEVRIVILIF